MPTQRLRVKGMTCAACVRRVEKVLTRVPEVQSATVNLATETAEVQTAQPVDIAALIDAIRAAGYDAEPIEQLHSPPKTTPRVRSSGDCGSASR
jgi:P-type Cu+ transporter